MAKLSIVNHPSTHRNRKEYKHLHEVNTKGFEFACDAPFPPT